MQPRVDIVALPEHAPALDILMAAVSTKYSRIPIYRDGIDDIVGVVFSKDLLDLILQPIEGGVNSAATDEPQKLLSKGYQFMNAFNISANEVSR